MSPRESKAHDIAARARISWDGRAWSVAAQTTALRRYRVRLDPAPATCACEDHALRGVTAPPCKHILAVRLFIEQPKGAVPGPTGPVAPTPARPTYAQADWPAYHAAQVNERRHFLPLLADLCSTIPEPPRKPGRGRKPVPLCDALFAAVSARRFNGDLEEAHAAGHIGQVPHFNSVLNVFDNEDAAPVLTEMIRRSALPPAAVESQFAVDSSGFSTSRFVRWFDEKYGIERSGHDWVKVHLTCGTKTHIVTAAIILDRNAPDVTQLPALLDATARGFKTAEVSADKAYTATPCFDAATRHGGTLYAPFKRNTTGGVGGVFERMFHYCSLRREEYLRHYHRRSNVEGVFSMVKRKFGDALRSRNETAMKNEVLAKLVAHNLCCPIAAWYELGIEPVFDEGATMDDGAPAILPFARPG